MGRACHQACSWLCREVCTTATGVLTLIASVYDQRPLVEGSKVLEALSLQAGVCCSLERGDGTILTGLVVHLQTKRDMLRVLPIPNKGVPRVFPSLMEHGNGPASPDWLYTCRHEERC